MTTSGREHVASLMASAALDLLDSLDAGQRSAMLFLLGDHEQFSWFYTPTNHGGLSLAEMTPSQQRLTHQMLSSGLSKAGYGTANAIMALENVLDSNEGWTSEFPDRERGRDPLLYWVAIFGDPKTRNWAWRLGGHHLSLNYRIANGALTSTTPSFFGADPADSPLLGPHLHRPLGAAEDLGRELAHALDEQQLGIARLSTVAPTDIVGANRTTITEGDRPLGLAKTFRHLSEQEAAFWDKRQQAAEAALGLSDSHLDALSFTSAPKGLSAATMNSSNKEILRAVLSCYLDRVPEALADEEHQKFKGDRIDSLSFAWAGGIERHEPHYYRIQGAGLFVEYDNTQRDTNHIHAVWRDLDNDFGRDSLAIHYANHDH